MAIDVPEWLLGRHITTVQVTAQELVAGSLAIPAGTPAQVGPIDFFTVVDEIEQTLETETENIVPMTSQAINAVVLAQGGGFSLTEVLRLDTPPVTSPLSSANHLFTLFRNWRHFEVVFTRAAQTHTGHYANGGCTVSVRRGKSTAVARFLPIQKFEAAPALTFAGSGNVTVT